MRPPLLIAAVVLILFAVGLAWVLRGGADSAPRPGRRAAAEESEHFPESVRTRAAATPENPPPAVGVAPASGHLAAGTEDPSSGTPAAGRSASDPAGMEVRRLIREGVLLRRRRDWARLAALQERIAGLSRRDVNILLHLLKEQTDPESVVMIGDLLARHEEAAGASSLANARVMLGRVFRRLAERTPAGPTEREAQVRAVEHLARWARDEDAGWLVGLIRDAGDGALRSAAGLAVAGAGDPAVWSAPLRDAVATAPDLRGASLLAVALDGVARRRKDEAARAHVRDAVLPDLRTRTARCEDAQEALEVLGGIALVSGRSAAEELAACWDAARDATDRRRLLTLAAHVASATEDVELLRARLRAPENDPAQAKEIDAAMAGLEERIGR